MSERLDNNNLRLDRVISSQTEFGPSVPDGGYGWLILIACIFLQTFIPSILASYGIFMLYSRIESSLMSEDPKLFDIALLPAPIAYIAISTLADPWSKYIVSTSTWPRLVTTTGIFLTCAGLLFQWLAIRDLMELYVFIFAGVLTGFGTSLALTQSETLISQYFRVKLPLINNILVCAYSFGFIFTPMMLGYMLYKRGILHSLLIYHAIIFQCVVMVLVFRKPKYLKAQRRQYNVLQNISEDDEMIFIQNSATENNTNATTNNPTSSTNPYAPTTTTENREQSNKTITFLAESFTNDLAQDLDSRYRDSNYDETPRPIAENDSNTTYTYDNTNNHDLPSPDRVTGTDFKEKLSLLWSLSFYKSLFYLITIKYAALVYWILFPTYLYVEMQSLNVQQTTFLVGSMGLGSLFVSIVTPFLPVIGNNGQNVSSVICFLCSIGFFVLSDAGSEGWLLFGALLIIISITVQYVLKPLIIRSILGLNYEKAHTILHTFAGLSVLLLLIQDSSYRNCFRIMSLLQLITGFLLFFSFLIKYFKKLCNR